MSASTAGQNGKLSLAAPWERAKSSGSEQRNAAAARRNTATNAPRRPQNDSALTYVELQHRVKDLVQLVVPRGATVLFISKGDEQLVDVPGRQGWHFPRAVNGLYAGCYPKESQEAIGQLRRLQRQGAQYLVVPSTAYWWLEFYRPLARFLERRHAVTAYQEDVAVVYRLVGDESDKRLQDASAYAKKARH
jgi:hypothetical protein